MFGRFGFKTESKLIFTFPDMADTPSKNPFHCTDKRSKLFDKKRLTGAHSPVRGHLRGSKVVPLNSWGRVSY